MVTDFDTLQRITRLSSLSEVLARIGEVPAIAPRDAETAAARGLVLAADVAVPQALPIVALALRDGFAVKSEFTRDAGSYAPIALPSVPLCLDAGDPLPTDCDAVAPLDTIAVHDGRAEAVAPVAAGDGVLPAGADASPPRSLRLAGQHLRASDLAVLAACGILRVRIRAPRIRLALAGGAISEMKKAALSLVADALEAEGATVIRDRPGVAEDFSNTLRDTSVDAVIGIGGTGSGRKDNAVQELARADRVAFHGIGITPGETSAFGFAGPRPVLLLPGRIDAALAGWRLLGKPLIGGLASRRDDEPAFTAALSRKVASTIGMTELIPVRRDGDQVEPLASGVLPLFALAGADGFILVPADSEGYPAGTKVTVRLLS